MANSEIPEEIVTDILKRLPVKSLKRFECVSPAWRALIKSPFFRDMHLKHHKNESSSSRSKEDEYILVLSSPRTKDGNAEFEFFTRGHAGELVPKPKPSAFPVFPHRKMELCSPCNGVFCVVTKIDDHEFYLCNPATRESRKLPERPFGFQPNKFPRSGVSYVVRTAWGFGVDSRTDDLKVVSVMYYGTPGDRNYFDTNGDDMYSFMVRCCPFVYNHGIIQFEIFDVGSNTWREVDVVLPDVVALVNRKKKKSRKNRKKNERYVYTMDHWRGTGVFCNGCIHWLYNSGLDEVILCFDISSETMQAFVVPFSPNESDSLMVLGDSIALLESGRILNDPTPIWVMEEYGVTESWVKKFCLSPNTTSLYPLFSWKDDDGDLLLFQAGKPKDVETLVSCSCSGDKYHTYPICKTNVPYLILRAIVISDQTLVSVGSTTSGQTSVSVGSTMMQAGIGGFRSLRHTTSCWAIVLVISFLISMLLLFVDYSAA